MYFKLTADLCNVDLIGCYSGAETKQRCVMFEVHVLNHCYHILDTLEHFMDYINFVDRSLLD